MEMLLGADHISHCMTRVKQGTNLGVHSATFAFGCTDFSLLDAEYPGGPAQSHILSHL